MNTVPLVNHDNLKIANIARGIVYSVARLLLWFSATRKGLLKYDPNESGSLQNLIFVLYYETNYYQQNHFKV